MANKIRIMLDPGHDHKSNVSPTNSKYVEGVQMFKLANFIKEELESTGNFEVFITRKKITDDPALAERGAMAGKNNCVFFISLHSDAFGTTGPAGTSVFYSFKRPDTKAFAANLAKNVSELMNKQTGVSYSRGAKTYAYPGTTNTDYYAVIRNAVKYSCVKYAFLIEHGFHTNKREVAFLLNDNNIKALAKVDAQAIYDEFKDLFDNPTPTPTPDVTPTVKAGDVYVLETAVKGYASAASALSNKDAKTTYPAGAYYVYKVLSGTINISTTKGKPGAWIDPADNVKKTLSKGAKYRVIDDVPGYVSAMNAKSNTNKKTTVKAGTYYVYNTSSGMINVTTDKTLKAPGSWINPADNK